MSAKTGWEGRSQQFGTRVGTDGTSIQALGPSQSKNSAPESLDWVYSVGRLEAKTEIPVKKAGLIPVRADTDIFATGKIIDQIWAGLNRAKVLVAELTGRNPNVLYELGLAHALHKPVVLISSNEADVPFDVRHVRVIYYELTEPFWGEKLIAKVAENIISAIKNPQEAIQFPKE